MAKVREQADIANGKKPEFNEESGLMTDDPNKKGSALDSANDGAAGGRLPSHGISHGYKLDQLMGATNGGMGAAVGAIVVPPAKMVAMDGTEIQVIEISAGVHSVIAERAPGVAERVNLKTNVKDAGLIGYKKMSKAEDNKIVYAHMQTTTQAQALVNGAVGVNGTSAHINPPPPPGGYAKYDIADDKSMLPVIIQSKSQQLAAYEKMGEETLQNYYQHGKVTNKRGSYKGLHSYIRQRAGSVPDLKDGKQVGPNGEVLNFIPLAQRVQQRPQGREEHTHASPWNPLKNGGKRMRTRKKALVELGKLGA